MNVEITFDKDTARAIAESEHQKAITAIEQQIEEMFRARVKTPDDVRKVSDLMYTYTILTGEIYNKIFEENTIV